MEPRAFNDFRLSLLEETGTELVWRFCAQSQRSKNARRKVTTVVGQNTSRLASDGGCDHMRVALVRKRHGTQGIVIRCNIRAGKRLLHFVPRPVESGLRIAKLLAATSHPFFVDGVRPNRTESAGFSDPQQEVAHTAPEQDTCVENCRIHNVKSPLGSVAKILGFSGERFKRSAPRRLLSPVGDHRTHRNAVMGADHATRQNALLDEAQKIRT
jgi:hypothetical protein